MTRLLATFATAVLASLGFALAATPTAVEPPRPALARYVVTWTPPIAVHAPRASRSRPAQVVRLSVTSYCATGNRTASGVWPRVGMAAGNRWAFGTRLAVPGRGVVVVTDRIGHGSDLDLFAASCHAAREWGRRELAVTVLPDDAERR